MSNILQPSFATIKSFAVFVPDRRSFATSTRQSTSSASFSTSSTSSSSSLRQSLGCWRLRRTRSWCPAPQRRPEKSVSSSRRSSRLRFRKRSRPYWPEKPFPVSESAACSSGPDSLEPRSPDSNSWLRNSGQISGWWSGTSAHARSSACCGTCTGRAGCSWSMWASPASWSCRTCRKTLLSLKCLEKVDANIFSS